MRQPTARPWLPLGQVARSSRVRKEGAARAYQVWFGGSRPAISFAGQRTFFSSLSIGKEIQPAFRKRPRERDSSPLFLSRSYPFVLPSPVVTIWLFFWQTFFFFGLDKSSHQQRERERKKRRPFPFSRPHRLFFFFFFFFFFLFSLSLSQSLRCLSLPFFSLLFVLNETA